MMGHQLSGSVGFEATLQVHDVMIIAVQLKGCTQFLIDLQYETLCHPMMWARLGEPL